jgi:zinc protease
MFKRHRFSDVLHKTILLLSVCILSILGFNAHALKPLRWRTDHDIPVVFYPSHAIPMLSIQLALDAGSLRDGAHDGLAQLTASLLNQGNIYYQTPRSAMDMAEKLADTGAIYNSQVGRDFTNLSLLTLTQPSQLEQALSLFQAIIHHPEFPLANIEQQKSLQRAAILSEQEDPAAVAFQHLMKTLYGEHPYAHPIQGTVKSIASISRPTILDFYHAHYTSEHTVMVLVGDINAAKAKAIAHQLAQEFRSNSKTFDIPTPTLIPKTITQHVAFPSTQTHILLGQLGIKPNDPDYFPLLVGNYILGGGSLTSELSQQIREQHGYSYHIQSELLPLLGIGPYFIQLSTQNRHAKDATTLTRNIVQHFIEHGPSTEELEKAKAYLIGSFPLSLTSTNEIGRILLKMTYHHLPEDFLESYSSHIQNVTAEQIKQAFQRHWKHKPWVEIQVGGP